LDGSRAAETDGCRHGLRHPPYGLRPFSGRKDWTPPDGGTASSLIHPPSRLTV
jgi:hypothetical protein